MWRIKSLFNNKDKNIHRSKVIYKGDCSCGIDYIGKTVRNLAVRIAESCSHLWTCWKLNFLHKLILFDIVPGCDAVRIVLPPSRGCRKTCAKILNTEFKHAHWNTIVFYILYLYSIMILPTLIGRFKSNLTNCNEILEKYISPLPRFH